MRPRLGGAVPSDADVFHAIADPTRRRLLDQLQKNEHTVNDLAAPFRMSRPAISQHLAILRSAGLVEARRDGRERVYRIVAVKLREVHDWVSHYERFWQQKLTALGEYLEKSE